MARARLIVRDAGLGKWLLMGLLVVAGLVLFLWLAPGASPVVEPASVESDAP